MTLRIRGHNNDGWCVACCRYGRTRASRPEYSRTRGARAAVVVTNTIEVTAGSAPSSAVTSGPPASRTWAMALARVVLARNGVAVVAGSAGRADGPAVAASAGSEVTSSCWVMTDSCERARRGPNRRLGPCPASTHHAPETNAPPARVSASTSARGAISIATTAIARRSNDSLPVRIP